MGTQNVLGIYFVLKLNICRLFGQMQYFLRLFVNARKRRKMNKNNAKDKYSNFEALVDKKHYFCFYIFTRF